MIIILFLTKLSNDSITHTELYLRSSYSSSRTYGGFSNEKMKREELLKLIESLQRDQVQYVDKPFYAAGYDSPFKLTNRRNEVWVLKKNPEEEK